MHTEQRVRKIPGVANLQSETGDMGFGLNWQIRITGGLRAHFNQADGTSLLGTDWAVDLSHGVKIYKILVRAYQRNVEGMTQEQETRAVAGYVAHLLRQGWSPEQYGGKPGELVYHAV